jgi:hypothetical protein
MTLRRIYQQIGFTNPDAVSRVWKGLKIGPRPGLDTVLTAEQVEAILGKMSQKNTKRKSWVCDGAANLLAEYRTGTVQPVRQPEPVNQTGNTSSRFSRSTEQVERPTKQPRTTPAQPAQQPAKRRFNWWGITMLDMVYLSTILTAVYGLIYNLREMGIFFAVPYCMVSWHAIRMAKNPNSRKTAQAGIAAVVILELFTFFIHLSMFNMRLVDAAKAGLLPFEYSFWGSTSAPFYIACILAGLFSLAGIYAVSVTFSLTSEKHTAAELERAKADQAVQRVAELEAALLEQIGNWQLVDGWRGVNRGAAERMVQKGLETLKK